MDAVLQALCLLAAAALPLTALWIVVARGLRQLQVSSAYGEVSRQLGLDTDTRGLSLQGHLGDRKLWIGEVMVGHGPERRMMTWGVLDLTRPLGLGLLARRRGRTTALLRRGQAPQATVGDPDLDRAFEVQGDDPARIRGLFTPQVRQALRGLTDEWPEVALTDRAVRVHLARPEASTGRLQRLVASMLELAEALEAARREVEPPARLAPSVAEWSALGARLGLQVETWLPGLEGTLDGRRVQLNLRRNDGGYEAGLRLWFAAHRNTGIRLRKQLEPDGYWSVGQDIQIGDPAFDRAFVIKGWDPERIREMLDTDTRAALLALAEVGHPEVDDRGLYVEGIALTPERLEASAHAALGVARALGW